MSERFVTQFTEVLPKILVIGEPLDFAFKLVNLFRSRSFKTEFLSIADLLSSSAASKEFAHEVYYKIIYLFNLSHNQQSVSDALQLLRKRREPLLILTRFDSILDVDDPQTHEWFQTSLAQYNNIVELARSLPRATLLIVRDLILADTYFHPAGNFLFGQISQQKIINPQQDFYFISQASFLEQIQNQLFAPYTGEKILFQATAIPSARAFRSFCQFLDFSCEITNQVYPAGVFEFPFPLVTITGPSDLNFISSGFFAFYSLPPAPSTPIPSAASQLVSKLVHSSSTPPAPEIPTYTFSLPPTTGARVKAQASKLPPTATGQRQARRILSQAKKVLTAKEEKFLHQYLADPQLDVSCRVIDLRGFDFLHCAVSPRVAPPPSGSSRAIHPTTPSPTAILDFYLPPSPTATLNSRSLRYDHPPVSLASLSHPSSILPFSPSMTLSPSSATPAISSAKAVFQPLKPKNSPTKKLAPVFPRLIFTSPHHSGATISPPRPLLARKNRQLFFAAAAAASITVFLYFVFLQPRQNAAITSDLLQQFFASCQDERCFARQTLSVPLLLSFAPSSSAQEFTADLSAFLDRYHRLEQQLVRYYSVAWQNQSGQVTKELQILEQSLSPALEALDQVRTSFTTYQAALTELIPSDQLSAFQTYLTTSGKQLASLSKNLPLLSQLAASPSLQASALVFDNHLAQTAGGQFLGVLNFSLSSGQVSAGSFQSALSLAANSSLTVNTPELLIDRPQMDQTGIYNLGFQRDFSQTAALASQLLESTASAKPNLLLSLNPAVITRLTQLTSTDTTPTLITDLQDQSPDAKTALLQSSLHNLQARLTALAPERVATFIYGLLAELDAQTIQFYTQDRALNSVIAGLNLDSNLRSVVCPSGLGSELCYLDAFAQADNYLTPSPGLTQNIVHQIDLSPRSTTHTRTITYANSAPTAAITYLSFTLPEGATVDSFRAGDIVSQLDDDHGFIVRVEPDRQFVAILKFSIPRAISKNDLTYSFYDLHQNGLTDQKLQVSFYNHLPYSPKIIAPAAINDQQNIIFNPITDQSFFGAVAF